VHVEEQAAVFQTRAGGQVWLGSRTVCNAKAWGLLLLNTNISVIWGGWDCMHDASKSLNFV
jgi:hypothetical protein